MNSVPDEIQTVMNEADCLYDESQIEAAIDVMAKNISKDLSGKNPIVFTVMNGGLVLTGKLVTKLGFPLEISYLHATRYRNQLSGTELDWKAFPAQSLKGRNILIVDDIYDEGHTLAAIIEHCVEENVASIKVAVLLDKIHDRKAKSDYHPDYVGIDCEDRYVFGFGMDYKGYWRNAPGIYAVKGL